MRKLSRRISVIAGAAFLAPRVASPPESAVAALTRQSH
jgi:hypothetical protein